MPAPAILKQVQALPDNPGVYIMKDAKGAVIYVGKATRLKARVRSYFGGPSGLAPKTRRLVGSVAELEYIVTGSESEALLLENNLIKRYQPRYNVRLRDDKTYPYLKIDLNEPWPRVLITRRRERDGARYFGPYTNSGAVRSTMALVKKLFPYRSCNKPITGTDPRPCLDFHIHRCLGPCIGAVGQAEYVGVIQEVILFLEGKQEQVANDLRTKMEAAAEDLAFERAAVLRDQIRAVERVIERQKIVADKRDDEDVIAFAQQDAQCCVEVFLVRQGKLFGREHFVLEGTQDETQSAIMASFLQQYYSSQSNIPPLLLLQHAPEGEGLVTEWLRDQRGKAIHLEVPQKGRKRQLVDMVATNAAETLMQMHVKWLADTGKTAAALTELQDTLELPRIPRRMEAYDISNISGTNAVGSMVVFEDGRPKPSEYRRFRIKGASGPDDFGMMQEMLRRRFARTKDMLTEEQLSELAEGADPEDLGLGYTEDENEAQRVQWGTLPDLVIIDGGRGHLNAVLEVMHELGVHFIPTCSLAKQQEEVFLPHVEESVMLPKTSQGLYLVQRIRDEAHRFAITYHRNVRSKAATKSALEEVPGLGPKKRKALIDAFGSLKAVREAPVEDIAAVRGMTTALAAKVKELV
ncbi:MAG: excinuclease ABC subunit UvrC [Dehalococcoidia bacterium]|nr:excinuclease ABC subunit UvrC [Dehalococcoidia bacterium]